VDNQSITTYDPNLNYETEYYWKVVARDSEGAETNGSIWKFTTPEPTITSGGTAEEGDSAIVHYTGRFQVNDTIFDTSREEVAREAGIYDEERTYEPIKIFINPNFDLTPPEGFGEYTFQMITGFINGLTNMTEGETKTVEIPPDEGYGDWNESIAEQLLGGSNTYPLESVSEFIQTDLISDFQTSFPDIELTEGATFDYGFTLFQEEDLMTGEILNVTEQEITYKIDFENNTTVKMPIFGWDTTFVKINETTFKVVSDIEEGYTTVYQYIFGNINIKAISVNETHAVLAMNIGAPAPYYVNQTLVFELEIIKLYKSSTLIE
jgi:hypothetical protein